MNYDVLKSMIEDMIDLFSDMWNEGILERFIIILISLLFLFLVSLCLYGVFYIIDTAGCELKSESCIVVSKDFSKAHTTTTLIPILTGKTTLLMPNTIHKDDEYIIEVKFKSGQICSTDVPKDFYKKTSIGDDLEGVFKTGRLLKNYHLVSLRSVKI